MRRTSVLTVYLILFLCSANAQVNDSCTTYTGISGICTPIKQCKVIIDLIKARAQDPNVRRFLRESVCRYENALPIVCCPQIRNEITTTTTTTTEVSIPDKRNVTEFPRQPACGISKGSIPRVVNGIPAKLGQFPWMVALGYRNKKNPETPNYLCGGTLITQRHVLTAAHCVYNRDDLYMARVGDLDLYSDTDGAKPENIPVQTTKIHEKYDRFQFLNDIALVVLVRDVDNPTITPICLPIVEPLRSQVFTRYNLFVAGWGSLYFQGPSSPNLQWVSLPVVSKQQCSTAYSNLSVIDDTVLCAGLPGSGKDTCKGDSGGPMMFGLSQGDLVTFYQIGIVSYGVRCADPNYPGVYTRITAFIDWIQNNL